ncbi:alpha/beta fold hydrolase [Nitrosococcus wardiae]|uniref:alpha/beta fold hydrolase n=1 Tax=Nitrosococcus wardiae TaxID=1814290 RepID=UPI001F0F11D6|nr:alpha/beta hydrolase [Nitrosococcus wardiae]
MKNFNPQSDEEAVQNRLENLKKKFVSRWVEINNLLVHARVNTERGPGDALPVVLVHGLGLSSTYLLPTAAELARNHHVYAPDLPGFGLSAKPRHILDVQELGDALAAWIEAFGLEQVALLGNSFGCQIIIECIARHPEKIARAVLQGPTTPPSERSWFWQFVRWQQNSNPKPMGEIAKQDYRACGIYRLLRTFQYSIRHRPEDLLSQIHIPVLVYGAVTILFAALNGLKRLCADYRRGEKSSSQAYSTLLYGPPRVNWQEYVGHFWQSKKKAKIISLKYDLACASVLFCFTKLRKPCSFPRLQ